jgi:hypothetical protein
VVARRDHLVDTPRHQFHLRFVDSSLGDIPREISWSRVTYPPCWAARSSTSLGIPIRSSMPLPGTRENPLVRCLRTLGAGLRLQREPWAVDFAERCLEPWVRAGFSCVANVGRWTSLSGVWNPGFGKRRKAPESPRCPRRYLTMAIT